MESRRIVRDSRNAPIVHVARLALRDVHDRCIALITQVAQDAPARIEQLCATSTSAQTPK